jgi:fimbrial chaperone protein
MVSREMAVDGTETLKPTDLFAIYPSRIILDASSVQIVKVQWKGPFDVSMEQNFRIIAEQVPVDFNGPKPVNIRILIRYMGAIYITPSNAVPNVVLDSVKHDTQNLAITLYNKGNAHVLMSNLTLQVKTSESFKIYSPEELKGFNGENMLAGLKRTFVVPLPPDMKGEDFSVTFKFDSIR